METTKTQIILDYFEYQRLLRDSKISSIVKSIVEENEGLSYEYNINSFMYDSADYTIRTKDISEIRKEHKKEIEESLEYIERLKNKIEELENRNLIQRILNK